jgi:hypothetical protein
MTKDGKSSHSLNLGRLAGMLPTPQTQGLKVADKQGKTRFLDLNLLPTPTAQDFKRRGPNSKQQGLSNVENWAKLLDGMSFQLNPQYVEAMMGFPENWTLSPFLNGGKNP